MPRYIYKGPVMEFNTLLADIWEGETVAPSEKKARSNLTYQFTGSHECESDSWETQRIIY